MSKKNRKQAQDNNPDQFVQEERTDKIELEGEVAEALPGTLFKVVVTNGGSTVLCTLAGKLRQNRIRVLPGDKVMIEVSPYDLSRGRISWRR